MRLDQNDEPKNWHLLTLLMDGDRKAYCSGI